MSWGKVTFLNGGICRWECGEYMLEDERHWHKEEEDMALADDLLDDLRPVIRGLDTVRVTKEDLLKALVDNRKEHRAIFEEAIDAWHKSVEKKLAKMIEQAKKGPDHVELMVGLPRPDDHTKDYDRAVRMIELSQDEEFELTQYDFAQYVMDEWGWQASFLSVSSNYSEQARGKFGRMS